MARCSTLGRKGRLANIGLSLGLGLALLGFSGWKLGQGFLSWRWPTASGEVVHSVYEVNRRSNGGDATYRAELKYTYKVDGRTHASESIGFLRFNDEAAVKSLILTHPAGSPITVYYDRGRPQAAVVLPGPGPLTWALPPLGLLLVLCGMALVPEKIPTREEAAFARQYMRHPAEVRAALEDAEAGIGWTAPADAWRKLVQKEWWKLLLVAVRTGALSLLAVLVLRMWWGPMVPDFPWDSPLIWGVTAAPTGLFLLQWLLMPWMARRPPEYRLVKAGIRCPGGKVPLLRWERIASFQTVRQGERPEYPMLVLHLKGGMKRWVLLPTGEKLDEVLATVRAHVPESEPEARHAGLRAGDWVCAVFAGVGWLICLSWVLEHYPQWARHGGATWLMLLTMVPGPALIIVPMLWRRRATPALLGLGSLLNLATLLTAGVMLATRTAMSR